MVEVAWCESRLEWDASNGQDFGVAQFAPSTYSSTSVGRRHPVRGWHHGGYWNVRWSALAMGEMWREGHQAAWECFGMVA